MKTPTVLIVEDDDAIRESLQEILEGEGCRVVATSNGRVALEHLEKGLYPNWILLDLMMPIMNGYEFLENFSKHIEWKKVPITLLSADGQIEKKAQTYGITNFLRKPVDLVDLLDELEKTCSNH